MQEEISGAIVPLKKRFFIPSNLDQLSTNTIVNYTEQENTLATKFKKNVPVLLHIKEEMLYLER